MAMLERQMLTFPQDIQDEFIQLRQRKQAPSLHLGQRRGLWRTASLYRTGLTNDLIADPINLCRDYNAQRKPICDVELSGVFDVRAATR